MRKEILFVLLSVAAFVSLESRAAEVSQFALTIETNWPPLEARIVDLYIPPTRPRAILAATRQHLFRADETQTNWVRLYTPAAPATILGVSGYAKASSAVYVVHSVGVARTRDNGASWSEAVPQDYETPKEAFLGLSVNPTNRREAAFAFAKSAWITRDFGESFTPLNLPAVDRLLGMAYAGADVCALVVLSESGLYVSMNGGQSWVSLSREPLKQGVLASPAQLPFALIAEPRGIIAYDLNRPGYRATHPLRSPVCEALATDCSGRGLLWGASSSELRLLGTAGEALESLASHSFGQPVGLVREHPRIPEQAFVVASNQVLLAQLDAAQAPDALTNLWNPASFARDSLVTQAHSDAPTGGQAEADVQRLISQVAMAEPSLADLLEAALKHARFSEKEINRWVKRARTRNWLPEFRVGTGFREYPLDQSEIYNYVDRYGIPQRDDLRLSDDVEPMGYVGVTLVWDLSRLLYDPEEVDINQEKRYEVAQRNALATQLSALYYERLELLVRARLRSEKMGMEERLAASLKIRQKTDLLNSLCGRPLLTWQSALVK